MGAGDACKVKPLRRAHWLRGHVVSVRGSQVTVRADRADGGRVYTVPSERVRG